MKRLTFEITIAASRQAVWAAMIGPETYQVWTAPFCDGSRFEGSWEPGDRIRFLGPDNMGMLSEVAEHLPAERISLHHLGMVDNGVPDTSSDMARDWAGAYENWHYADVPGGCQLTAEVDVSPNFEGFVLEKYPMALSALKALCEEGGAL
ncbi:SRPBCC domain-containing protein [Hydrogenophaga sp. 5NK40-0174]|uniref:SRPBCC family protein n=1 Tax=Hydrogenophaga sp. 5NK40-0174 TaxID=3127649 RepID=UPI00310B8DF2